MGGSVEVPVISAECVMCNLYLIVPDIRAEKHSARGDNERFKSPGKRIEADRKCFQKLGNRWATPCIFSHVECGGKCDRVVPGRRQIGTNFSAKWPRRSHFTALSDPAAEGIGTMVLVRC